MVPFPSFSRGPWAIFPHKGLMPWAQGQLGSPALHARWSVNVRPKFRLLCHGQRVPAFYPEAQCARA